MPRVLVINNSSSSLKAKLFHADGTRRAFRYAHIGHGGFADHTPAAEFAVQYFCQQTRAAIGAFAAKVGVIDALVFTAGIGEHSRVVRELICQPLDFLGFQLDDAANLQSATYLHRPDSKPILCIPADEEGEICRLVQAFHPAS